MKSTRHFILTRFHTPITTSTSSIRGNKVLSDEQWLRHRIPYFEKLCVPSVAGQTNSDFTWVLLYSPDSPEWVQNYLHSIPLRNAIPLKITNVEDDLPVWVRGNALSPHIVTTRLDSDDALAFDFVARLRQEDVSEPGTVINFRHGLRLTPSGLLRAHHRSNSFASLVENADSCAFATVLGTAHDDLASRYRIVQAPGGPAWLQAIHDRNIGNVAAGLPARPERYRATFPGLYDVQRWGLIDYLRLVKPQKVVRRRISAFANRLQS